MDFFSMNRENIKKESAPLAERMRPESLDEISGQKHFLGQGKPLDRLIKSDRISSMIFYGPPGTGKTSLAYVISKTSSMYFEKISAVTSGVKEMREILNRAEENLGYGQKKTILFIDEIHRFNKGQQDLLLPYVEEGTIILIGATTENPYFEVNSALLSRCQIVELYPLKRDELEEVLNRALEDDKRGLGNYDIVFFGDAKDDLIDLSDGDARVLLNSLEIAVLSTEGDKNGRIVLDREAIEESSQKKIASYDKSGDQHYDVVSAFIKSMRGSDPDATAYYLARMINAGEDPKFIMRRIMICAAEDVGLADPNALIVATSAFHAAHAVGYPEARIIMAEAALYVATAPKSNRSYMAIEGAQAYTRGHPNQDIPSYLKDSHYKGAEKLGHGLGYKYPHDFEDSLVRQTYLPEEAEGESFYRPTKRGHEKKIDDYLSYIEKNIYDRRKDD